MHKKLQLLKWLTVGIILLFFETGIAQAVQMNEKSLSLPALDGKWLYVGGNGPGNYSRIQEAIDAACDGDTVFVYNDSSPYHEIVIINKSIRLIGEDTESTVIDGTGLGKHLINVLAGNILITGFTIQNASGQWSYSGMAIESANNIVVNNIFQQNSDAGIRLDSNYNVIQGNRFYSNIWGIYIYVSSYNTITRNSIGYNGDGIGFGGAFHNNCSFNTIYENRRSGIELDWCNGNNTVYQNNIIENNFGILLMLSSDNKFLQNNFIDNGVNARFQRNIIYEEINKIYSATSHPDYLKDYHVLRLNFWDGNYWDKPRISAYPIFGRYGFPGWMTILNVFYFPNLINFDRHPAQEPYKIP